MRYIEATDGTKLAVYDYNPCGKETVVLVQMCIRDRFWIFDNTGPFIVPRGTFQSGGIR